MRKGNIPTRGSTQIRLTYPCRHCGTTRGLALPIGLDRWYATCGVCDSKVGALDTLPRATGEVRP